MTQVLQGVIMALVPLLVIQSGALIYWAGQITRAVRDHDQQLKERSEECKQCKSLVIRLGDREGLTL